MSSIRMRMTGMMVLLAAIASATWADPLVRMNSDEAEIVLAILDSVAAGGEASPGDWERLFTSEPYVRLKKREAAMKRDFTDDEFRAFVRSPELVARREALRATLEAWRAVDLEAPVSKASVYLPEGAKIRATIYPVIKPMTNSFVFEVDTDPAIFLYVDPEVAPEKLENTLAHELHHIGFGSHCPAPEVEGEIEALPDDVSWIVRRLGAFGEGFAMLAAAGGPETHPHAASDAEDRARWDADVERVAEDMKTVAAFFEGSLDGSLSDEEKSATFLSFYGVQGPWYTVGWFMATTIERELGREALIEAFCDTRALLATYNRAAERRSEREGTDVPMWPGRIARRMGGGSAM